MQTPTPSQLQTIAVEAALKAAKIQVHYYQHHTFEVSYKGDVNLVTTADIESEKAIIETIRKTFPDHAILAEESQAGHAQSMDGPIWVIDPLDGTNNFAHGFPFFAISIAYRQDGETKFGLIYQPLLQEMFIAHLGGGAFLNDKPIHVSKRNQIAKALMSTGFPYDRRTSDRNNLSEFCTIELNALCVRRPGAATIDLAYVACGRLDGHWEPGLAPWDVTAGTLIVQEAGGKVTDYANKTLTDMRCKEIVATNGLIHDTVIDLLSHARANLLPKKNFKTL